jgi:hypothetical protein
LYLPGSYNARRALAETLFPEERDLNEEERGLNERLQNLLRQEETVQ